MVIYYTICTNTNNTTGTTCCAGSAFFLEHTPFRMVFFSGVHVKQCCVTVAQELGQDSHSRLDTTLI